MAQLLPQDLPINRDFLNPKFEGYKLSLEEIKLKEVKITEAGVLQIKLSDDLFSYQHLRALSQINSLTVDPWNRNVVYWISKKLEIVGFSDEIVRTFVVGEISNGGQLPDSHIQNFHVGMSFPSSNQAIIYDGSGRLLLAHCPNRLTDPVEKWNIEQVCYQGKESAILISSSTWKRDNSDIFEVVLLSFEEFVPEENQSQSGERNGSSTHSSKEFQSVLEWLIISKNANGLAVERTRTLTGKCAPNYVVIEVEGKALVISGESLFRFSSDTAKPVVDQDDQQTESVPEVSIPSEPEYIYMQTPEEITIRFTAPSGLTKQQFNYSLTPMEISLAHDSGKVLLEGPFYAEVNADQSTWTIDNNMIEIKLVKKIPQRWLEVVTNDNRGMEVSSDEERAAILERFSGMTSDKLVTQEDANMMNPEQLEECDTLPVDSACWLRIDGESHRLTHKIDVSGNQFLFSAILEPNEFPTICLRYNVDGVLFRPSHPITQSDPAMTHVGTFSALGYVMASKRDKKFASCSPNVTFAAICDGDRNVYIYRNDVPLDSLLINRKTGKYVKTIAKQHVVTLDKIGSILGFAVNNSSIFILKSDVLFVATI